MLSPLLLTCRVSGAFIVALSVMFIVWCVLVGTLMARNSGV